MNCINLNFKHLATMKKQEGCNARKAIKIQASKTDKYKMERCDWQGKETSDSHQVHFYLTLLIVYSLDNGL